MNHFNLPPNIKQHHNLLYSFDTYGIFPIINVADFVKKDNATADGPCTFAPNLN